MSIVPDNSSRKTFRAVAALISLAIFLLLLPSLRIHVRAAALLLRIQNPQNPGWLANFDAHAIEATTIEVSGPAGPIRARLYTPIGVKNARAMVVVHGVHHLGIEEPRLVAFARALSMSGIRVLTPEVAELADYHVDPSSIDVIGWSAKGLSESVGQKVGVLGISFSGGLSLLAASELEYESAIRFVMTIGAHDDLERVSEFLVSNRTVRPDGTILQMKAHEYGPTVLIYSHLEDFFPPSDLIVAHQTLQLLLWEKESEARKAAEELSPAARKMMEFIFSHQTAELADQMHRVIGEHREEMAQVSPHGRLNSLHVPVLLLHGREDNVIPPSELLWLESDVPRNQLRGALISPAISHASMEGEPPVADKIRLAHFMSEMLGSLQE